MTFDALASPYVDSTGMVRYPKQPPGGGKCYTPKNAKPKCAFHRYSKPGALPSRCIHPHIGKPLDRNTINGMTACPMYEPDANNADAILATVPARLGVPTGDDNKDTDILIQLKRAKQAMTIQGGVGEVGKVRDAFISKLERKDEIRIGSVLLPRRDASVVDDYGQRLVPRLRFTYRDNINDQQGSLLEFIARAVEENDIALLVGHLGTGKTTGVMKVAEMVGAPLSVTNCDGQLTVEQIIGTRIPDKDPSGATILRWQDAPLLRAYREGYWACIDDFTFTGSDVFSAIFGLMTNEYYQVLVTGEIVQKHPDFRLFLTTNPPEFVELYPNRQQPDASFLSRVGARFWVSYLKPGAEREAMREAAPLLSEDLLDRMQRVIKMSRDYLERQDINFAFSTRHAVNWARKVSRHQDLRRAALEAFVADMDTESKNVMLDKILDSQVD